MRLYAGPALAVAVELNHPEVVDLLLGHQADLRLAHRSGSLVSLATSRGYHAILRLLLANGAKPNDPGAFYMAVDHEDLVALRMLLSSGADANIKVRDGETALLLACRLGRPLAATLLLQVGVQHQTSSTAQQSRRHSPRYHCAVAVRAV